MNILRHTLMSALLCLSTSIALADVQFIKRVADNNTHNIFSTEDDISFVESKEKYTSYRSVSTGFSSHTEKIVLRPLQINHQFIRFDYVGGFWQAFKDDCFVDTFLVKKSIQLKTFLDLIAKDPTSIQVMDLTYSRQNQSAIKFIYVEDSVNINNVPYFELNKLIYRNNKTGQFSEIKF